MEGFIASEGCSSEEEEVYEWEDDTLSLMDGMDLMWEHFWDCSEQLTAIGEMERVNVSVPGTSHDWLEAAETREGLPHRKLFSSFSEENEDHVNFILELHNAWDLTIRGMQGAIWEARADRDRKVDELITACSEGDYHKWIWRHCQKYDPPTVEEALSMWKRRKQLTEEKDKLFFLSKEERKKRSRLSKYEKDLEDARDDKRYRAICNELETLF